LIDDIKTLEEEEKKMISNIFSYGRMSLLCDDALIRGAVFASGMGWFLVFRFD
jgi:hypothetical protein